VRILFVNLYFPPDAAGSAYILGELAEDLAASHDVCVVVGRPSYNAQRTTYQPAGVRVIRVPSAAFDRSRLTGRALNYATFTVLAAIRASFVRRPDLIVTMTDPPVIGVIGAICALRHRRPFVQISHDVYPDIAIALGKLRNPVLAALWRLSNRLVRRTASLIIVVGRDMQEKLAAQGVPADKLAFVPTWGLRQEVDDEGVRETRDRLGWANRFVVMHAGNMGPAQHLETLLDAAERLREHEDTRVVFLGDGAAKTSLVRKAERRGLHNVEFLAYLPKTEAQALMAAADVHVVSLAPGLWGCAAPSKTYGIMAAGRPFVAAVDPGSEPARIIEEFGCGETVPAGDGGELAAALGRMRHESLGELGERGRVGFGVRYERSAATSRTQRLLETVQGRR
jgi:glycosyltransferase involved in cell wall biosynthesis